MASKKIDQDALIKKVFKKVNKDMSISNKTQF